MSSAVSYELLLSKQGTANGLATLDSSAKIPVSQLPSSVVQVYKGQYATTTDLTNAYPNATLADYAYVTATSSFWYWNAALTTPAWVNQQITEAAYNALSTAVKAAVPYIVEP